MKLKRTITAVALATALALGSSVVIADEKGATEKSIKGMSDKLV